MERGDAALAIGIEIPTPTSLRIERLGGTLKDFINPVTIQQLSEEQLRELIEQIRTRRMTAVIQFQAIQADRQRAKEEVYRQRYERVCTRMAKIIEQIDGLIVKLDEQMYKAKILKLEAFDEV